MKHRAGKQNTKIVTDDTLFPPHKVTNTLHVKRVTVYYEGRSINKLQNGAIPSVLEVGKIEIYVLWGI